MKQTDPQTKTESKSTHDDPVRRPAVDVWEDAEAVYVVAELPGVAKEDLTLHVEKGTLNLVGRATRRQPDKLRQSGTEFLSGSFERSFRLSDEINVDGIKAQLNHGLLRLVLPKKAATQPRRIVINGG